MKKYLILAVTALTILIPHLNFGQEIEQLKLTPSGIEPIVVEIADLKASQLYEKAQNWVQETYKNPDKVLKANIENEKIRISGFANDALWFKTFGIRHDSDMKYLIEISFKDGKYRFEFIIDQFYAKNGQKEMYNSNSFYKKNGDVRKTYTDAIPSLEQWIFW